MRNYVQSGDNLTLPAPYDVDSGDGVLIGHIFGVAASDAEEAADVDLVTIGVFTLPKAAGAIDIGDEIFWDDEEGEVTATPGSADTKIGVAVETVSSPAASVAVRLNGSF